MSRLRIERLFLASTLVIASGGCLQILGLDSYKEGAGGSSTTTSSSVTGASTGTGMSCMPGDLPACYSGDPATKNVGSCKEGAATCIAGQLSACMGEVTPKPEDPYAKGDESCDGIATGDPLWGRAFDADLIFPLSLSVDPMGNLVAIGFFQGTVNFGPSPADALVSQVEQDFFVAKFAPDGKYIWSRRFGKSTNDIAISGATDTNGNIFLVGFFKTFANFGGADMDATTGGQGFLVKLGPDGGFLAQTQMNLGGTGLTSIPRVAVLPSGFPVVSATFNTTLTFANGASIVTTGLGAAVASFDRVTLALSWKEGFLDSNVDGDQTVSDIAIDHNGNIVIGGSFTGSLDTNGIGPFVADQRDGFLMRLSDTGAPSWAAVAGGVGDAEVDSVDIDAAGEVVAGGIFGGHIDLIGANNVSTSFDSAGLTDVYVWKLTSLGQQAWAKAFGDATDQATPVQIYGGALGRLSAQGDVLFGGGFKGSLNLGGGPLPSGGDVDAYVGLFAGDGTPNFAKRFGDAAPLQLLLDARFTPDGATALALVNGGTMDVGTGPLKPKAPAPMQMVLTKIWK